MSSDNAAVGMLTTNGVQLTFLLAIFLGFSAFWLAPLPIGPIDWKAKQDKQENESYL
jgi:hypothetical protein